MKKRVAIVSLFLLISTVGAACPFCNRQVSQGIYNSASYLPVILSAFIALAVIMFVLIAFGAKRHRVRQTAYPGKKLFSAMPLTTTSMILGMGLGGFVDGIVLHQVLQYHEMLSNKIPSTDYVGKSVNMFWDGVFHGFCLIVVLTGVILLWRLSKRKDVDMSGRLLAGGLLAGWGIFNIVEGVIDHHWLQLHNVIEVSADHDQANYAFLMVSVIMILLGYLLCRKRTKVIHSS